MLVLINKIKTKRVKIRGRYEDIDAGIAKYIRELNSLGLPTNWSCSAMRRDNHHVDIEYAYVDFDFKNKTLEYKKCILNSSRASGVTHIDNEYSRGISLFKKYTNDNSIDIWFSKLLSEVKKRKCYKL